MFCRRLQLRYKIGKKKAYIFPNLLLLLLVGTQLTPASSGVTNHIKHESVLSQTQIQLADETSTIGSTQLILDSLDIIFERVTSSGTWYLPSDSDDPRKYTGLVGGMAGTGLKLLELRKNPLSTLPSSVNQILLLSAEAIATDLIENVIDINETHAIWEIYQGSQIVDLGVDFGLSGISLFFSELYNQTGNNEYQTISKNILRTIYDSANKTNGLHWQSELNILVDEIYWYDPLDLTYFDNDFPATFIGQSLGTVGTATAALTYLSKTGDFTNENAWDLINSTLKYLESQMIINGTEMLFDIAEEFTGLRSTNYATGAIGIADFYFELFKVTTNSSYFDNGQLLLNWLNDSDSDEVRYLSTLVVNGTIEEDFEFGKDYGLAGISHYYQKFGSDLNEPLLTELSVSVLNYLNTFAIIVDKQLKFGERLINNQIRRIGSNTLTFGSTGIFEIMSEISRKLDKQALLDKAQMMKPYLTSFQVNVGNFTGLASFYTGEVENNPSFGIPSYLNALLYKTVGSLSVTEELIDFGNTEIGSNRSRLLILENLGEQRIDANLQITGSEGLFYVDNSSISLGEREIFAMPVFFEPLREEKSSSSIVVSNDDISFVVILTGNGFDTPTLNIKSSSPDRLIENDTIIDDFITVDFEIEIVDSSPIEVARLSVNGSVRPLNSEGPNVFSISWSTDGLSNGTYILDFEATDILGHTGQKKYVYKVAIYTPSLAEEVFSNTTRNYLIGLIVVVLVVGAIFTKRKISS